MVATRSYHNIALVGFMGAGKSTVGHLLAELLGYEFLDTDKVIEQRANQRITQIFAQQGEAAFRQMEGDLVGELALLQNKVIATGGGMVVNPDHMQSLKSHSLVVCLWASPETIYERVRHQNHRPLLHTPDPLAKIRQMLLERGPHYRAADIMIGVDFRHANEVARHLVKSFQDVRGNARHS